MTAFDAAIRIKPDDASGLHKSGNTSGKSWTITIKLSLIWIGAIELNSSLAFPYLDRGVSRLCRADDDGALSDLRTYCQFAPNNPNAGYAHLLIWVIRARHNQRADADRELTDALGPEGMTSTACTPTIARFLLGRISEGELLAATISRDGNQDRSRLCDARYFAGMTRLIAGDKPIAANNLRKSLETSEVQSFTYILARSQLGSLTPLP